jgi:hypothetical protein
MVGCKVRRPHDQRGTGLCLQLREPGVRGCEQQNIWRWDAIDIGRDQRDFQRCLRLPLIRLDSRPVEARVCTVRLDSACKCHISVHRTTIVRRRNLDGHDFSVRAEDRGYLPLVYSRG